MSNCTSCGAPLMDNAQFCPTCGANVASVSASSQPVNRPVGWMIASIICSVLAIGAVPPLFGGLAIFFGYQAYKRDAGIGRVCMAIGGVALIVGFVSGALWGAENIRF